MESHEKFHGSSHHQPESIDMGVSENVVYPFLPNGFADHYPVFKWLFHWEYTQHFQTNPYVPFPRSVFVAWIFSRDLGPAIDLAGPQKTGLPKKREVQQLGGSPMKNGDEWLLNWKNTEFEPTKIEIDYPKPLFNHEK